MGENKDINTSDSEKLNSQWEEILGILSHLFYQHFSFNESMRVIYDKNLGLNMSKRAL